MAAELHTYRCPLCQALMTTSVVAPGPSVYRCPLCRSWMRYGWSDPITSDAQRALAERGVVFNPHRPPPALTRRPCDYCRRTVAAADLQRVNRKVYCSPACAEAGTARLQAVVDAVDHRLADLYHQQPWLKPPSLETKP